MYAVAAESESKKYFKHLRESYHQLFTNRCIQHVIETQVYNPLYLNAIASLVMQKGMRVRTPVENGIAG